MSLALNDRRVDFAGNDVTTSFSYDFKIYAQDYLQVIVSNDTTEEETTLVITTDYTVAGVGGVSGGTVTLVDANQAWLDAGTGGLKTGYTLTIVGVTPLTQTTDIRNQGPYYPSLHEDAFDKLTMLVQELSAKIRRAPLFAFLAGVGDRVFPNPDPGKAIIWGSTGQLENTAVDINAIDQAVADTAASAAAAAASESASSASESAAAASALAAAASIGAYVNMNDYGSVLNANLTIPSNATYSFIRVNSPAASRTITLPAANAFAAGRQFTVWDVGANAGGWPITVQRAGADTIEGSTSVSLSQANIMRTFITDGTSRWSVSTLKQQEVNSTMILDSAVSTAKIAADAVTTAKILNSNVTTAKIADGNVTPAKLSALGQQVGTDSGNQVINATDAQFTNGSISITTTGRPVFIGLMPKNSTTDEARVLLGTPGGGAVSVSGLVYFQRAGTTICNFRITMSPDPGSGANAKSISFPPGGFFYIDTPAAGTYTYTVRGNAGSSLFNIDFVRLVAYEL
jgi:hypothetical protein